MAKSMNLAGFRVTNFRSIEDSGWVETDNITSLIGTNESGKTNLLIPLWKLKPAKEGEINPLADYPRKRFNEIRNMAEKPIFIEAKFQLSESLVKQIVEMTGAQREDVSLVLVRRKLDGTYDVEFPNAQHRAELPGSDIGSMLSAAEREIQHSDEASELDEPVREALLEAVKKAQSCLSIHGKLVGAEGLKQIEEVLVSTLSNEMYQSSNIVSRYTQLCDALKETIKAATPPLFRSFEDVRQLILEQVPSFVYYSNYGNLDSEIYLPHVIENIKRDDLSGREAAKGRTLKVLFEFVRLKPEEILELGKEFPPAQGFPNATQIKQIADKKTEREILLQSASAELTTKFRNWWKQGEYRLRFQADGNHFRIWVSDDRRPEEIELEGRSTGLQWFLSFYLIFLVESADSHEDAVLLLDEPGLSLHPLAQKDLSQFFENLSMTNQLLYTTHSPFLVDPDHLDRVKAVYVNEFGFTTVSSNLREGLSKAEQSKSIYPVHAALGLSVSDTLLQGCQPIIVEGPSDQLYLSAIKNYLIGKGLITPSHEIIFVPAGGVRGVGAVVSMLTAKDEQLPHVILDSDGSGISLAKQLKGGQYQGHSDRIIEMKDVIGMSGAEIEDLFPSEFLSNIVTRHLRGPEDDFSEIAKTDEPIIPQIEAYANANDIILEPGWKVEIAKKAKAVILKRDVMKSHPERLEKWQELFAKMDGVAVKSK